MAFTCTLISLNSLILMILWSYLVSWNLNEKLLKTYPNLRMNLIWEFKKKFKTKTKRSS
jgi:hypothetical protein